jgi:glycosyltransferase involved in cell wall biosynthesis
MPDCYPRVLLINGAAFGPHSATAITLTNLFQDWPAERLALAHLDADAANPGGGICSRVWRLSLADVPVDRTIRKLLGRQKERVLGRAAVGMPSGLGASGGGTAVLWRGRLHGVASAWADLLPLRPPPAFESWLTEFQPEVIYSMLGSTRIMRLVLRAAKHCRAPIVPHFMDDWPATHYRGSSKAIPRVIMLARLRSVLRRSPVGLCIGPAMAAEYEQRYGLHFRPFMNCVDVPDECGTGPATNPARPMMLLFFGGLHLNRWRGLESMGRALLALREEGHPAELIIHTSKAEIAQYGKALSANPLIRLREMLPLDHLKSALQAADVLVHVDSFDAALRRYLRFSMSTKLPLCMASGRPLLAYGPRELASCRYILDSQCGVVVGEQDANLLLEAMRALASDPLRRAELGRCGWEVAKENHHCGVVRERFRLVLADAASSVRTVTGAMPDLVAHA